MNTEQLKQAPEHQHQISSLFSFFAQATHKTVKMRQGVLRCYWIMLHGKHNMFIKHTPDLSYTYLGPLFLWHFSFVGADVQEKGHWSVMLHHPFLIALLSSVQNPLIYELIENHDCNLFVSFEGKKYIKMIIQTIFNCLQPFVFSLKIYLQFGCSLSPLLVTKGL